MGNNPDYGMDVTAEQGTEARHAVMTVRVKRLTRHGADSVRVHGSVRHKGRDYDLLLRVDQDGLGQVLSAIEAQDAAKVREDLSASGTALLAVPVDAGFGGTFLPPERSADGREVAVLEVQDVWIGEE